MSTNRLAHFKAGASAKGTRKLVLKKQPELTREETIRFSEEVNFLFGLFDQHFPLSQVHQIYQTCAEDIDKAIDELMSLDALGLDGSLLAVSDSSKDVDQLASARQELSEMFPEETCGYLEAKLIANSINVQAATDDILQEQSKSAEKTGHDLNISKLAEMFPAIQLKTLEKVLIEANGDLEDAVQCLLTGEEGILSDETSKEKGPPNPICKGECISQGFPCLRHSEFVATAKSQPSKIMPRISNTPGKSTTFRLVSGVAGPLIQSALYANSSSSPQNDVAGSKVPEQLLAEAQTAREAAKNLAKERTALFHKAASVFTRPGGNSKIAGWGSAQYYADEVYFPPSFGQFMKIGTREI